MRLTSLRSITAAAAVLGFLAIPEAVQARDLTIVTWNLGWHMDRNLAAEWIAACDGPFIDKNGTMTPASGSMTSGWEVDFRKPVAWDWNRLPVCDVYKDYRFDTVPAPIASYVKRYDQARSYIQNKLNPDIIAFQEVSGEAAVREVLPPGYELCSFDTYKVQRLAIAWKSALGPATECEVEDALSLPGNPDADRPRPGLSVALNMDGEILRILSVHLKSGCVSPLEDDGDLTGDDRNCTILQQQVVPFEHWLEAKSADTDRFVILGDFNRNFWHEVNQTGPVRTDNSSPDTPLPAGVKVLDFQAEVFDGVPASSAVTLLQEECAVNAIAALICAEGKSRLVLGAEADVLRHSAYLGCRNPLGLDHVLIGAGLSAAAPVQHMPIGAIGGTRRAGGPSGGPLLAVSDHCPMLVTLTLQ